MKKGVPMTIVKATAKGQILIPAPIRKKLSIGKGTPLRISREGNRILVEPVQKDVVEAGRGMLKSRGRVRILDCPLPGEAVSATGCFFFRDRRRTGMVFYIRSQA